MSTKLKTLVLAAMPLVLGGCSWLTDFRQQPSVGTWQQASPDSTVQLEAVASGSTCRPDISTGI